MKNLSENNLIRFINLSRKKDGIFANFKAKGVRGGAVFSASITIDIATAEVDPGDPLEKIIELCAKMAVDEFKRSNFQFEGLAAI
ncbi:hypothetical protein N9Y92_02100 [Chlamydiales bacterium]|nr:hypothetical protein [Chlamydiales bacterium]